MVASTATSGWQFGQYEIERKLGHGMTDVYVALDAAENRQVVLKIIRHGQDAATQRVIEAERRGASIQKQLHAFDARVIEVYEFGDLDGCFFVAMQYVEGENVAQILRRERRLEPARAARIALEIASQLERLHSFEAQIEGRAAAVVHGDIKPSNIQVGNDGRVWLMDFGIAKSITVQHDMTLHDFGSPSYCSPERLDQARVDQHADLWAAGVTLYEMVAGAPPYQADSTRKLEHLIQSKRPPRALPAGCPRGLNAIIAKALAASAPERYCSATALRADLEAFLEHRQTAAEGEKREPWRVNPTVEAVHRSPVEGRWGARIAQVAGALGWFLFGLGLFFATVQFKQRYFPPPPRAVRQPEKPSREAYLAAADAIMDAYRGSPEPALEKFDWRKAQSSLEYAVGMDGADRAAQGKLALARGYVDLVSAIAWTGPAEQLDRWRQSARAHFEEAAAALPRSPDAHLALARLHVYSFRDAARALEEFRRTEALGYKLGPREIEQEADVYRFRAWKEIAQSEWPPARRDLQTARRLYEGIPGFSRADAHLRQVKAAAARIAPKPPPKKVPRRAKSRSRRWR